MLIIWVTLLVIAGIVLSVLAAAFREEQAQPRKRLVFHAVAEQTLADMNALAAKFAKP